MAMAGPKEADNQRILNEPTSDLLLLLVVVVVDNAGLCVSVWKVAAGA